MARPQLALLLALSFALSAPQARAESFLECLGLFRSSGDRIILRAGHRPVDPHVADLSFPKIEYLPLKKGETPAQRAAATFGVKALRKINSGATRDVYEHPTDRTKVIKVYRAPFEFGNGNSGTEDDIPLLVQRELALEEHIRRAGWSVAAISRNPKYINRGIIVQDRILGKELSEYRRTHPFDPAVDQQVASFHEFEAFYQNAMERALQAQFGDRLPGRVFYFMDWYSAMGTVRVAHEGNFFIDQNGHVWTIDF